jgi:hypothetical protein
VSEARFQEPIHEGTTWAESDVLAVGRSFIAIAEAHGVSIADVIQAASERLVEWKHLAAFVKKVQA